ncbi:MAG: hypothetical protein LC800_09055 [Acidobacteria bacterium]|nr:hypothetical protein [Acidobacteriota bacterium]
MSFAEVEISEWRTERRHSPEVRNVSEEEIERQLAEAGLIRLPSIPRQPAGEFVRINVGGKPLSETIIEERR